ncbi:hypothetical protein ATG_17510 [Desulfurococcaceae archaeon AG1]|nr:hypothetical protein ATG_17510 [Desulfurococcaceae archaeon AG1]
MSLADRPVDEILRELRGAARDTFLNHKALYIESLLSAYHLDPARIGYRRDLIEDFLIEHCSGLTVNECFAKIERMVREAGGRRKLEDLADTLAKSIEDMARAMTRIDIYCSSWGLDRDTCDELRKVERDPCLDGQVVRRVLTGYFRSLGATEAEYRGAVEEAANYIESLRKARLCVRWDHVANAIRNMYEAERARREETLLRAKDIQRTLDRFLRERVERRVEVPAVARVPTPAPTPARPTPQPYPARPAPQKQPRIIPWLGRPAGVELPQLANRLRAMGKRLEILTEGVLYNIYLGFWLERIRSAYRERNETPDEFIGAGGVACVELDDIATTLVVVEFRDSSFMLRTIDFCCRNCIMYYRGRDGRVKLYWTLQT